MLLATIKTIQILQSDLEHERWKSQALLNMLSFLREVAYAPEELDLVKMDQSRDILAEPWTTFEGFHMLEDEDVQPG